MIQIRQRANNKHEKSDIADSKSTSMLRELDVVYFVAYW